MKAEPGPGLYNTRQNATLEQWALLKPLPTKRSWNMECHRRQTEIQPHTSAGIQQGWCNCCHRWTNTPKQQQNNKILPVSALSTNISGEFEKDSRPLCPEELFWLLLLRSLTKESEKWRVVSQDTLSSGEHQGGCAHPRHTPEQDRANSATSACCWQLQHWKLNLCSTINMNTWTNMNKCFNCF